MLRLETVNPLTTVNVNKYFDQSLSVSKYIVSLYYTYKSEKNMYTQSHLIEERKIQNYRERIEREMIDSNHNAFCVHEFKEISD